MIHFKPQLNINDELSNNEICEIFKVAPRSGMRRSLKTNTLVLISDPTKEKYSDRWEDDVLYYTGMGLQNDQSLEFQQNKTLYRSNLMDIDIHLFEVKREGRYLYKGLVYLAAEPYQERQIDINKKMRNVWIFPLKQIDVENNAQEDRFLPLEFGSTSFTGYWTFFCNPTKWQLDRFLETNGTYDTYQVTKWQRHHFKPGQLGIIRVGNDNRNKSQLNGRKKLIPGVYAIVEIMSEAHIRNEKPDNFWIEWKK